MTEQDRIVKLKTRIDRLVKVCEHRRKRLKNLQIKTRRVIGERKATKNALVCMRATVGKIQMLCNQKDDTIKELKKEIERLKNINI